jgi:hypothetical protein
VRLRHLDPDRPAADDDEVIRPLGVGEHGLVGEVGNALHPGIGGTAALDPVATTMRRARMRVPFTSSSRGPTKRAAPWITLTPRPSNRSTESFGAIAAITSWTWRLTAAKSTLGGA